MKAMVDGRGKGIGGQKNKKRVSMVINTRTSVAGVVTITHTYTDMKLGSKTMILLVNDKSAIFFKASI